MTSTDDSPFRSITGARESAEPAAAASTTTPSTSTSASASNPMPPPAAPASSNRALPPASASASASAADSAPARPAAMNGRSLTVSGSPSTTNSPLSSRDSSPARAHRQQGPTNPLPRSGLRSRKNSTDVSPSRAPSLATSATTVPSAAAIQRALSSANIPQLPPGQEPRAPRPQKAASGTNSGETTPHWPVSPRLKSPPPSTDSRSRSRRNSLRTQPKKADSPSASAPSIVVQSSSPASTSRILKDEGANSDPDEQAPITMKASSRGASGVAPKLETVQEASLPTTPGFEGLEVQSTPSNAPGSKSSDEERSDVTTSKVTEDLSTRVSKRLESSSDNSATRTDPKGKMQEQRAASNAPRPTVLPSKASFSSLSTVKSRTEAPSRNMTVETETVPSVPQTAIGNQDRTASGRVDGSLRLRPSNETIRPKKEKAKPKRKAPSINSGTGMSPRAPFSHHHHPSKPDIGPHSVSVSSFSGSIGSPVFNDRRSTLTVSPQSPEMAMRRPSIRSTSSFLYFYPNSTDTSLRKASSKADVFEQKVASAVDEANSSDSDETFVYESNPPDAQPHRSRHHHSRTPSMTSIASLVDPRSVIRDAHKPGKKSSMKFANNPYNVLSQDADGSERGDGTIRINSARASGGSHHHHIGRHGQGRGSLAHLQHSHLQDSDSSMAQSSRARGASSRAPSQPNSPKFHTFRVGNANGNGSSNKKNGEYSAYDIDAENAADDERTPLISTVRAPRQSRTPRRPATASSRHYERHHRRESGWCRRFAGCLVLSILLLVLIFSAVGLVFATTKPLSVLRVRQIQNVIASQEELMLDLVVDAVNPNIIGVTISETDVIVFAKSKHVGSDRWWREHKGSHRNQEHWLPISDSSTTLRKDAAVHVTDGVDEGTDPIEDPSVGEPRTMSLGRIFHFDSPLNFDGSFFKRHSVESLGEMRLTKPGNKTEAGGTARWEEVLQYPFELIVRGVFKYQLPLSTREHTVPITATYLYDPDAEKKKKLNVPPQSELDPRTLSPKPVHVSSFAQPGRYDVRRRALLSLEG